MIWVKLNCLKFSDELETSSSLDITVEVKPWQTPSVKVGVAKSSCQEQWSVRPIKSRKDTLSHPENVIHDCTAGSPTEREFYGDGNSIVVGGVVSTHGGWENQPQGEGS